MANLKIKNLQKGFEGFSIIKGNLQGDVSRLTPGKPLDSGGFAPLAHVQTANLAHQR